MGKLSVVSRPYVVTYYDNFFAVYSSSKTKAKNVVRGRKGPSDWYDSFEWKFTTAVPATREVLSRFRREFKEAKKTLTRIYLGDEDFLNRWIVRSRFRDE